MPDHSEFQIGRYWLAREPNGIYHIYWYEGGGRRVKRQSLRTRDYGEAETKAVAHFLATTTTQEQNGLTVRQAILKYYTEHACKLVSAEAARLAGVRIDLFLTDHDDALLAQNWTRQDTDALVKWFRTTPYNGKIVSDNSINRYLDVLRAAFRFCLDRPPTVQRIQGVQARDGRPKPTLTLAQTRQLFAYAFADKGRQHLQAYLMAAYTTLARPEAILDISTDPDRAQIEWDYDVLHLNPAGRMQTKKYRPSLPINPYLLSWLKAADGFLVQYNGKKLSAIRQTWNKAKDDLGWPMTRDWDAKMIRHTMAKYLRSRGVDWAELQGQLGHRMPGITDTYAVYDPTYLGSVQAEITAYMDQIFADKKLDCSRVALELENRVIELKSGKAL